MTNPILDLPLDCIVRPSRPDLIKIEAMMLWPDDPTMRAEAEQTSVATFAAEIAHNLDDRMRLELVRVALAATPPRKIHERVTVEKGGPFVQGLVAGEILFFSLSRAALGLPDALMKCVLDDVAVKFSGVWMINKKTIENVTWPHYRPVAHFWAAYRSLVMKHGPDYVFPCGVNDLPIFLGLAESYRTLGEVTRTKQSPTTILRPSESVRLPPGLAVPGISLGFSPGAQISSKAEAQ